MPAYRHFLFPFPRATKEIGDVCTQATARTAEIEIVHEYEFSDQVHCQTVLVFSTPHFFKFIVTWNPQRKAAQTVDEDHAGAKPPIKSVI